MELKDFVEQKKIEKEEAAKAERARQIAVAEKGMREEEERRGKDEALQQDEEFEKLEEIRRRVSSLEQEKKDVLDSLAGWKVGREEMVSAAKTAKEKRKKLKEVVEEGKEFFAEEGIQDVKGILKSEKFVEAGEVNSYQESERALFEKVKELKSHRRKAIGQERGHLSKAEKETAKKLEKINHEIQELREQTPEGQRELKETAKKEILERHKNLNHWVLYMYDDLRSTNFVTHEDLKLVPKAGEGLVKETILKYYLGQLDDQLDRESGGVAVLKKELENLKKLSEKMEEANHALKKLEEVRREAELAMKSASGYEEIEKSAGTKDYLTLTREDEQAQKSSRANVNNYLAWLTVTRKQSGENIPDIDDFSGFKINRQVVEDFKYIEKDPGRIINLYRGKEVNMRQDVKFVFSFTNPEYIIETAKIFTDFLKTLSEILKEKKSPDLVLSHREDPRLQHFYKPSKVEKINQDSFFSINRPTYEALHRGARDELYKIHQFETRQKMAGEAVAAKFEKDWNQAKLQELDREKKAYEVAQKKKGIDVWKERAKEVLSQLPELRLKLKEKLDEKITVVQGGNLRNKSIGEDFVVTCREIQKEASETEDKAKELEKEAEPLKEKIRLKRANEPKWFGREKYMAELEELEQQQHDLGQKIEKHKTEARELYHLATSIARDVAKVLELSGAVNWDVVNQREFTVKELLSLAEKKAKEDSETKLSPAEEVTYKKRLDLEEAVERNLQKIRKIYPNY